MEDCKMCMVPQIQLDVNHMMSATLGERGISEQEIAALRDAAEKAYENVRAHRGQGWLGWTELPYNQEAVIADIEKTAAEVRKQFDTFVVLGIGGSALGPIAVQQALNHLHYNELPAEKRGGPRFYVEDNIDPERMAALFDVIDVKTTCFNVITKSGGTAETMSQYLIFTDALKKAVGDDWAKHIITTTGADRGNLIKLTRENGFKHFIVPDGVGGRYSEMCPVGLFPAAVCGIDIRAMLKGAACMDKRCQSGDVWQNPALMEAVLQYIATERGMNVQAVMPYADSLKYMADWYAQLWAESLGKNVHRDGTPCAAGQTPVKSLGVTDQHSQVQLYTEGPDDKVITFLRVADFRSKITIPVGCEEFPDVSFLCGKTLNELLDAELHATEYALLKAAKPSWMITLPEVNAYTLGQLMYFFEMQTAYAGELLDVDAFNQPGVEEGKNAAYALLGRKGYETKAIELDARPESDTRYVL